MFIRVVVVVVDWRCAAVRPAGHASHQWTKFWINPNVEIHTILRWCLARYKTALPTFTYITCSCLIITSPPRLFFAPQVSSKIIIIIIFYSKLGEHEGLMRKPARKHDDILLCTTRQALLYYLSVSCCLLLILSSLKPLALYLDPFACLQVPRRSHQGRHNCGTHIHTYTHTALEAQKFSRKYIIL